MRALLTRTRAPRRAALLVASAALATGFAGTTAATATAAPATAAAPAAAASPAGTCTFDSPITARTASVGAVQIELRYSTSTRCAWGRITHATPGDSVWTHRSYDGGKTFERLDIAQVQSGSDTHTASRYDGGVLMRACALNHLSGVTNCTAWY
ncbi:DUF2690 domain-containing protein [Kitasatospora sp. NPDC101235]|uniref:DUF2690 domain-containing protein n=1 Tax=Kitasatospora sp. NPDC101235 TaxID=3364101 RepID=UPI0037F623EE